MIFNTTTKSEYVLFVKSRGFKDAPNVSSLNNIENDEYQENINLAVDPKPEDNIIETYLPVAILLEDQIVDKIKLIKLGLYKLQGDKINTILKSLRPIRIANKTAGVKAGFIKFWKAEFKLNGQEPVGDFRKQYSVSFVTPYKISIDDIETHLYKFGNIKVNEDKLNYKYLRGSARLIGGRKYKNLS